jgi:methylated-DNA-[protein]-cysteine S-methyltransferase
MEARAEDGVLVYLGFTPNVPLGEEPPGPNLRYTEPFRGLGHWLDDYFAGRIPEVPVKYVLRGTPFQQLVWRRILKVPYGQVTNFKELGREVYDLMGRTMNSPRTVGQAVDGNPLSIIVPSHRVLALTGEVGGYVSGVEKKIALLRIEGITPRPPDAPGASGSVETVAGGAPPAKTRARPARMREGTARDRPEAGARRGGALPGPDETGGPG